MGENFGYTFGEPVEDEATKQLRESLQASVKEYCEKSASIIGGAISAEFAKKDETITALRAHIEELTSQVKELEIASTEFIGHIKSGNNAKAHLQMLVLEAVIEEITHLTAYKEAQG
jgi:hypothetical protein